MPLDFFNQPLSFVVWVAAILVALSGHEFAHAFMATKLGDRTAELMGRLTLNPIAHIDPIGFIALILIGFGWGKPVPFDPNQLRSKRFGPGFVGIAGPLANLIMAIIAGVVLKAVMIFFSFGPDNLLVLFLFLLVLLNLILMVFNLIPLPPLDGSKLLFALLPRRAFSAQVFLERFGPLFLLLLIIFDRALPVPILGTLFRGVFSLMERIF